MESVIEILEKMIGDMRLEAGFRNGLVTAKALIEQATAEEPEEEDSEEEDDEEQEDERSEIWVVQDTRTGKFRTHVRQSDCMTAWSDDLADARLWRGDMVRFAKISAHRMNTNSGTTDAIRAVTLADLDAEAEAENESEE